MTTTQQDKQEGEASIEAVVWNDWGISQRIKAAREELATEVVEALKNAIEDALQGESFGSEKIDFHVDDVPGVDGAQAKFFWKNDDDSRDGLSNVRIIVVSADGPISAKVEAALPNTRILGRSMEESKEYVADLAQTISDDGPEPNDVEQADSRNALASRTVAADKCTGAIPPVDGFVTRVLNVFQTFCAIPRWFGRLHLEDELVEEDVNSAAAPAPAESLDY